MSASCILATVQPKRPITGPLLTTAEVAAIFRVDPKTVQRWGRSGKLTAIRTLGGHRRYIEAEVRRLRDGLAPGDLDSFDGLDAF